MDKTLREIGQIDYEIEAMEAKYNRKITDLKAALADKAAPLKERKTLLERLIKEFSEAHKDGWTAKITGTQFWTDRVPAVN